jgi:hypothetical protein
LPAALLQSIAASLGPTLSPVRPLARNGLLAAAVFLLSAAVAFAGATRMGFGGVTAMPMATRAIIFGLLTLCGCVASVHMVTQWVPGSRSRIGSSGLVALVSLALLIVFGFLFRDYHTSHFLVAGIACLATGVLFALPAGLLALWWLRRGWVVNPVAAGTAAGVVAGLAGVALLELHCTNFQASHILVWHMLVLPVSAVAGAVVGRVAAAYASRARTA